MQASLSGSGSRSRDGGAARTVRAILACAQVDGAVDRNRAHRVLAEQHHGCGGVWWFDVVGMVGREPVLI
jgi:hypothetical protein